MPGILVFEDDENLNRGITFVGNLDMELVLHLFWTLKEKS